MSLQKNSKWYLCCSVTSAPALFLSRNLAAGRLHQRSCEFCVFVLVRCRCICIPYHGRVVRRPLAFHRAFGLQAPRLHGWHQTYIHTKVCYRTRTGCYCTVRVTGYHVLGVTQVAATLVEAEQDKALCIRDDNKCPVFRVSFKAGTEGCRPKHALAIGAQLPKLAT